MGKRLTGEIFIGFYKFTSIPTTKLAFIKVQTMISIYLLFILLKEYFDFSVYEIVKGL